MRRVTSQKMSAVTLKWIAFLALALVACSGGGPSDVGVDATPEARVRQENQQTPSPNFTKAEVKALVTPITDRRSLATYAPRYSEKSVATYTPSYSAKSLATYVPSARPTKHAQAGSANNSPGNLTDGFGGRECVTRSDPSPVFTHPVVQRESIEATLPPGLAASGMIKPHGYFFVKHDQSWNEDTWDGYPRSVPVHAPVESFLRTVHPYTSGAYGRQVSEPPIEYMLIFEVSCEVYYKLDHLGPLPDKISDAGPFPIDTSTQLGDPLYFAGGEVISYWSGVNPAGNVDLGVYNTTVEGNFANQTRFSDGYHDQQLNQDCPFNYFPTELRNEYYELFKDITTGEIIGNQSCRTPANYDVPGSIAGEWFNDELYSPLFSASTSLAGDVLLTFREHADTGGHLDIQIAVGDSTYIDPSEVTDKHCYYNGYGGVDSEQHPATYVDVSLTSPATLQVEYGTGNCDNRVPIEILKLIR